MRSTDYLDLSDLGQLEVRRVYQNQRLSQVYHKLRLEVWK